MYPNAIKGITLEGKKGEISTVRTILETIGTPDTRALAVHIRSLHGQQRRNRHIGGVTVNKIKPEEYVVVPLAPDHSDIVIGSLARTAEGSLPSLDAATRKLAAVMLQELANQSTATAGPDPNPAWGHHALQPKGTT